MKLGHDRSPYAVAAPRSQKFKTKINLPFTVLSFNPGAWEGRRKGRRKRLDSVCEELTHNPGAVPSLGGR
jgi:hypothetical protein